MGWGFSLSAAFHNRHAFVIGLLQILSVAIFAVMSLWFGAWYPDAQKALQTEVVTNPDFWLVCKSNVSWTTPVVWVALLPFVTILSGVSSLVSLARLKSLEVKEEEFKLEQEDHSDTQKYYYESIQDNLKYAICDQIPGFSDQCRASIYRVDNDSQKFRLVYRFSKIQRFSEKGRYSLPLREGFLHAAYSDGDSLCMSNLPPKNAKKGAYFKAVSAFLAQYATSIPQATLNGLTMDSRCYYAYSIRDAGRANAKFAILILESLEPTQFNQQVLDGVLANNIQNIQHYVRHIAHLDSKLNPYGAGTI